MSDTCTRAKGHNEETHMDSRRSFREDTYAVLKNVVKHITMFREAFSMNAGVEAVTNIRNDVRQAVNKICGMDSTQNMRDYSCPTR